MQAVAAALIHRQGLGGVGLDMWHNLAQMAASLASKDTHAVAGHLPEVNCTMEYDTLQMLTPFPPSSPPPLLPIPDPSSNLTPL